MRAVQFNEAAVGETRLLRHTLMQLPQFFFALTRSLGGSRYRPEKHYMRGTGPKARAKQQAAFASSSR
ncbi:MAG: hypothetical protein R3D27_13125 [Hyphomicrobiaceae bacterium]